MRLCAAIGVSRTSCTGDWTWCSTKTRLETAKGIVPRIWALLRKLALNLARLEPSKESIRGKLKRAGWDNGYLAIILSQFTRIQMQ